MNFTSCEKRRPIISGLPTNLPNFVIQKRALKDLITTIARTLLKKNIAFCLYRFPNSAQWHLAIEPAHLPGKKTVSFLIAPFVERSAASEICLDVVQESDLGEDFLEYLESLPDQAIDFGDLPEETSREAYMSRIGAYLHDIRAGSLEKAILSRVFHVDKPQGFDPVECFEQLCAGYPATFVHLSLHRGGLWMGATPELLLGKTGSQYQTMALAGTQPRQESPEYYWRDKELEEHDMVCRHIEQVFLEQHCKIEAKEGPATVETGKVAHLRTMYRFEESAPVSLRTLLHALHPTPAVGGLPLQAGIDCILEHEGYDRKYYCGFIGETDFEHIARLFINLRCMQIGRHSIAIFVGGGITAASDPQEEWEETIIKSKTMVEKIYPVNEFQ